MLYYALTKQQQRVTTMFKIKTLKFVFATPRIAPAPKRKHNSKASQAKLWHAIRARRLRNGGNGHFAARYAIGF